MTRPLRDYRLDAGLTQQQLADRAGVALTTVILAESGKRTPHPPNRKKIADALAYVLGYSVSVTSIKEFGDGDDTQARRQSARP